MHMSRCPCCPSGPTGRFIPIAVVNASNSGANSSTTLNFFSNHFPPIFPVSRRSSSNGNAGVRQAHPLVPCTNTNDEIAELYVEVPCTTTPQASRIRNEIPSSTSRNRSASFFHECALTSTGSSSTNHRLVFTQYTPKSIRGPPPATLESSSHGTDLPATCSSLNEVLITSILPNFPL